MDIEVYGYRMADDKDYCGLRYADNKEIITETIYDSIRAITDSLYIAVANERYCVLDRDGVEVLSPIYKKLQMLDDAGEFYLAAQDDLYGIVSREGELVLPYLYYNIFYDRESCQMKGIREYGSDDVEILVLPEKVNVSQSFKCNNADYRYQCDDFNGVSSVGLVDGDGNTVMQCRYAEIRPLYFGYALVRTHDDYYGVCRMRGEEFVIKPDVIRHSPYYDFTWYLRSVSYIKADVQQMSIILCMSHDKFKIGNNEYFICENTDIVKTAVPMPVELCDDEGMSCRMFAVVEDEDTTYALEEYLSIVKDSDVVFDANGNEVEDVNSLIMNAIKPDSGLFVKAYRNNDGELAGYDYVDVNGARIFHRLFDRASDFRHGYAYVSVRDRQFFINREGEEFDCLHDTYYSKKSQSDVF